MKSWAKQDLAHPLRPVILPADVSHTLFLNVYVYMFSFMLGGVSVQGALGDVNAIKNDSCYCKQQLILMREFPLYVFD